MAEVKILIEGFTNADCKKLGKEPTTAPTISLIRDGDILGVVDPGEMISQKLLIDALAKEKLKIEDITHVFITHSHLDHYRNVGMFPETTKVVEFFGEWQEGRDHDIEEGNYSENVQLVMTPGHNHDGITFLVKTNEGVVAIAGDVWWKEDFPEIDPYASDPAKLAQSRQKITELADFVIPGHGPMFKVKK